MPPSLSLSATHLSLRYAYHMRTSTKQGLHLLASLMSDHHDHGQLYTAVPLALASSYESCTCTLLYRQIQISASSWPCTQICRLDRRQGYAKSLPPMVCNGTSYPGFQPMLVQLSCPAQTLRGLACKGHATRIIQA